MSDEQPTSGTAVNPATGTHAPRPGAPVMDVVPPPAQAAIATQPPVVAAPPELPDIPQISDEIAEQIAADSTSPPTPEISKIASPQTQAPVMSTPPEEDGPEAPPAGNSPSDVIQAEINHDAANPVPAAVRAPKVANPVHTAVIATIIMTLMLVGLAIFAYTSTQN